MVLEAGGACPLTEVDDEEEKEVDGIRVIPDGKCPV